MEFTLKAYASLINTIRSNGYVITDYMNYGKYEKSVIIKHDVDMSLSRALAFAEFEHELGIRTTYNVLLCSDFYNPYSKKNMECMIKMMDLGHEIGLHYDEVRHEGDVLENINRELDILASFLGKRVNSLSMHRPSEHTLKANYQIDNGRIINSYSEEFFKEFKYISDSRMNWREDPVEAIESGKYDRIHILTHPIWYADKEETISERLKKFLEEASPERYETLKDNIRDLTSIL